jgi:hypothetical protein
MRDNLPSDPALSSEHALTERLSTDIGRFEPGFAPVAAVLSYGKALRAKRRAVWAGLTIAAVLAVAAPIALTAGGGAAEPASPSGSPPTVTVDPPHTDAHGLPVFSGAIGGKQWTASVVNQPHPGCLPSFGFCPQQVPAPADPVDLLATGDAKTNRLVLLFRTDAAGAEVLFRDGDHVTLQPVPLQGLRLALLALPVGDDIDQIVAHTASGDRTAIPFNSPDGSVELTRWYAPGALPKPSASQAKIASGRGAGPMELASKTASTGPQMDWQATAYVGPYGVCIVQGWGTGLYTRCTPQGQQPPTGLPFYNVYDPTQSQTIATEVDPAVDHITITYDDGTHTTLRPVRVAGHAFVALVEPLGHSILSAPSYDSSGHMIADPHSTLPSKTGP